MQVISVAQAKDYLRVDHTSSDKEIERMIRSALGLIEEKTNHLLYKRDVVYRLKDGQVHVYDGPINTSGTTGLAATVDRYDFSNYSVFTDSNADNPTITLSVGYESPEEIPMSLLQAAYEMIDYWYYKNDGTVSLSLIGDGAREVINTYSRFLI